MYYEDLSAYRYYLPKGASYSDVLNVGWLDQAHSFSTGLLDTQFLSRLKEIILGSENANFLVNKIRGVHS